MQGETRRGLELEAPEASPQILEREREKYSRVERESRERARERERENGDDGGRERGERAVGSDQTQPRRAHLRQAPLRSRAPRQAPCIFFFPLSALISKKKKKKIRVLL